MPTMTAFDAYRVIMDHKRVKQILPRIAKEVVCDMFNVTGEELLGDVRFGGVMDARQFYCKLLRDYGSHRSSQFSYREIGDTFWVNKGGHSKAPRNHASVLHNVRVLNSRMNLKQYAELSDVYKACSGEVKRRIENKHIG